VRNALADLLPEHCEILILREMEELSYREIASIIGVPMGTVMSRISRGANRLHQNLAPQVDAEANSKYPEGVLNMSASSTDRRRSSCQDKAWGDGVVQLLAERHKRRFYGSSAAFYRIPSDVEDVLQQAHLRALQHFGQFEGRSNILASLTRVRGQ